MAFESHPDPIPDPCSLCCWQVLARWMALFCDLLCHHNFSNIRAQDVFSTLGAMEQPYMLREWKSSDIEWTRLLYLPLTSPSTSYLPDFRRTRPALLQQDFRTFFWEERDSFTLTVMTSNTAMRSCKTSSFAIRRWWQVCNKFDLKFPVKEFAGNVVFRHDSLLGGRGGLATLFLHSFPFMVPDDAILLSDNSAAVLTAEADFRDKNLNFRQHLHLFYLGTKEK